MSSNQYQEADQYSNDEIESDEKLKSDNDEESDGKLNSDNDEERCKLCHEKNFSEESNNDVEVSREQLEVSFILINIQWV